LNPIYLLREAPLLGELGEALVAVKICVVKTQGSVPRDPGAVMLVTNDQVFDTIGGGHLEFEAIAKAREFLAGASAVNGRLKTSVETHRFALGPSLGQCCGGVVWLAFELLTQFQVRQLGRAQWHARPAMALFGGGHVGEAIAAQMVLLQWRLVWLDSRDQLRPQLQHPLLTFEHQDPVQDAVADLEPGSSVLIMSFSHAEDLAIVQACLTRQRRRGDLPFVGLIGSATKWASFRHRLAERGYASHELDHITCPIGEPHQTGKEPAQIALAVAMQLTTHANQGRT
jgi:xanthine dehydrogenase accessory factor